MCDKAVYNYSHTLEFIPDQCKTQKMCEKAVDTCTFLFDPPPDQYMTLEICNKVISKEPSMLK